MSIKAGDKVPAATLKVMTPDGPANATTAELFGAGKVVMFSVPGATVIVSAVLPEIVRI